MAKYSCYALPDMKYSCFTFLIQRLTIDVSKGTSIFDGRQDDDTSHFYRNLRAAVLKILA